MIGGVRIKVCGLTTLVDAEAADAAGADFLGFNFYPKSPRYVAPTQFSAMAARLPPRKKVAVAVVPTVDDLKAWASGGCDLFQIHFPVATPSALLGAWAEAVGPEKLWLAPKLPPGTRFLPEIALHAQTILWDTYASDAYGGTGRTGDWAGFRVAREEHPRLTWVLAGGLSPENIGAAIQATGARVLDVNSGVETAPGIKDPARLAAFVAAVRSAVVPGSS